jgi:Domain of unknown function (DUF4160)
LSPTILRNGPYRFFFFSNEGTEPPHIHIKGSGGEAKFWLEPVSLAYNYGYAGHELRRVERLVADNKVLFMEAWNDYASRK